MLMMHGANMKIKNCLFVKHHCVSRKGFTQSNK